jgi:hypothetical protein
MSRFVSTVKMLCDLIVVGVILYAGYWALFVGPPEEFGPPMLAEDVLCKYRGGTFFYREEKCVAVQEIPL